MAEGPAYLRVAHPIDAWDGSKADDGVAQSLRDQPSWSLFALHGAVTVEAVLGAWHGWRKGPLRLGPHGYALFSESELSRLGGTLEESPAFFAWPLDVSRAHCDLLGGAVFAAHLFAPPGTPPNRLVPVEPAQCLSWQVRLALREDCPDEFRTLVAERCQKVSARAPTIWADTLALQIGAKSLIEEVEP